MAFLQVPETYLVALEEAIALAMRSLNSADPGSTLRLRALMHLHNAVVLARAEAKKDMEGMP